MAVKHAKKGESMKKSKAKSAGKSAMKAKPATMTKKAGPVTKPFTKTEILGEIAMNTGITQKQAGAVLESLQLVIGRHLKKGGAGAFVLPGLLKCQVVHKPATKARKGINPFTGLETMFKAKPARNLVKVKALKKLKEMV
jgi:nucleoid DNA-binding protein